ncbi:UNVERIFIED_CONTAM: HNH endonuclease [Acetivibrio alkalicellulosi]
MNTKLLKREIADILSMTIEELGDIRFLKNPIEVKGVPAPKGKHYKNLKGDCWTITSHKARSEENGYPVLKSPSIGLHRYFYERAYEEIPEGLHVLHKCDNKSCVNPHHLFLGTDKDNANDRGAKGRTAKGERQGSAKLTGEQVKAIFHDTRLQKDIAKEYGISRPLVSSIKNRKAWTHITKNENDKSLA